MKHDEDDDTLTIVYQRGFADGKRAAQLEQKKTNVRYTRSELNEFEQIEDGTWEADRNG
jgi:hypothetical protein